MGNCDLKIKKIISETARRPASVRTPKWRMFTFTFQNFADTGDGGAAHMAVLPPLPLMYMPPDVVNNYWMPVRNALPFAFFFTFDRSCALSFLYLPLAVVWPLDDRSH